MDGRACGSAARGGARQGGATYGGRGARNCGAHPRTLDECGALALKGCIVLGLGIGSVADDAEACFSKAVAWADKQQSKMLSLRAATSLAQLWECQGFRNKARKLLARHYQALAEGFDTPDLKQAKNLLDAFQ